MNPRERREHIMGRLQQGGKAGLTELAEELGTSTMTIRRDIRQLAESGLASISVGIVYLGDGAAARAADDSAEASPPCKRSIGQAAAKVVEDGDTIIVDCGSTTCELLRHIGAKRLTVITNSLPVASVVGSNPRVKLIYAPGEYSRDSQGMVGPLAEEFFQTLRADKAFLGAHGFDASGGVNEPVLGDATAKRAMLAVSEQTYLLVDSGKYGNVHLKSMNQLSDYGCVITDSGFPQDRREELEAACNQVIYA